MSGFILSLIFAYLAVLVLIGLYARSALSPSSESFVMGGRVFRGLTIFGSIFGTNMTAFVMIGIPGEAYLNGWEVWQYFSISFLVIPISFYLVGYKAWKLGKEFGIKTHQQITKLRWNCKAVDGILFTLLLLYTIPYIAIGAIGAGILFEIISNGLVSYELGALIILVVVWSYTFLGGLRGTIWTNVFQASVFLAMTFALFVTLPDAAGNGFSSTMVTLIENQTEMISRSSVDPKIVISWIFIMSLVGVMFPHLFQRILAARTSGGLKLTCTLYPIVGGFFQFMTVMIGVFGVVFVPNLPKSNADQILPVLVFRFYPDLFVGLIGAAILAALMSSLDSQLLALSSYLSEDFIGRGIPQPFEQYSLFITRGILSLLVAFAYAMALLQPDSIVGIAEFAFSGYTVTGIAFFAALNWRRMTKEAAVASMLVGNGSLIAFHFIPVLQPLTFGFFPAVPAFFIGLVTAVVVSLLTPPPDKERTEQLFDIIERTK